jgi:hypothetical protein
MDLGCVQPCMITKVFKTGVLNLQGCKSEYIEINDKIAF